MRTIILLLKMFGTKGSILWATYLWALVLGLAGTFLVEYGTLSFGVFCFVVAGITSIIVPLTMIDTKTHHIQEWVRRAEVIWNERPKKLTNEERVERLLDERRV